MDAKEKTIETIKTETGCTTVATMTITIGMTTKTVPTVNTWARNTRTIVPFLKRSGRSKRRIGTGVTAIRIMRTTEASQSVTQAQRKSVSPTRERGMNTPSPATGHMFFVTQGVAAKV